MFWKGSVFMNTLPIVLDLNSGKHLYEQIYEYIKNEISAGKLPRGQKLPSARSLAEYLQISRSTVDLAYEQLLSEGYLEAVERKGFFVQTSEDMLRLPIPKRKEKSSGETKEKSYLYDFSPNGLDKASFPFETWKKINKEILSANGREMFLSGDPKGELELRQTIQQYLYVSRGVECDPQQIIVGAGNDYLLLLLEKILGENKTVAMEIPSYPKAHRIFKNCSYNVVDIPMDEQGMNVEKLQNSNADLVYVMPSHQFPTGIVMPIGRRMELILWASQKEDRFIIEDDYDSEFRYRGRLIPALQGAGGMEKVIYIGTFSKSIAPSIRISFMVLPNNLLEVYEQKAAFYSSTVSRMEQKVLSEFMSGGYFERHLNRCRKIYKEKHDFLLMECKGLQSLFTVTGENAGLHIVLHCKKEISEEVLVDKAAGVGVRVYGMHQYSENKSMDQEAKILLGYGGMSVQEIHLGMEKLKEAWKL